MNAVAPPYRAQRAAPPQLSQRAALPQRAQRVALRLRARCILRKSSKKQTALDAIEKNLFLREQCIFLSDHLKERNDLFGENVAFLEREKSHQISALRLAEAAEEAARQAYRTSERCIGTDRLEESAETLYRQAAARVICLKQLINILDERLASIQETLRGLNAEQEEHLALQQARERDILAVDAETQIVTTSGLQEEKPNFDLAYKVIQLSNKINFVAEISNPPRGWGIFGLREKISEPYVKVLRETGNLLPKAQQEANRKRFGILEGDHTPWSAILLNCSSREIHVAKTIIRFQSPMVPTSISRQIAALTIMVAKNKGPAVEMRFPISLAGCEKTNWSLVEIHQHLMRHGPLSRSIQEAWRIAVADEKAHGPFDCLSSDFPLRLGVKQDSQISLRLRWNIALSDFQKEHLITHAEFKILNAFVESDPPKCCVL